MHCGKFVPARAALRDLALRPADFKHPRLDIEVEMGERMP